MLRMGVRAMAREKALGGRKEEGGVQACRETDWDRT